jgi:hypothetical protein
VTTRTGPCEMTLDRPNTRAVRWRCACGSTGRWLRDSSDERVERLWRVHREQAEGKAS